MDHGKNEKFTDRENNGADVASLLEPPTPYKPPPLGLLPSVLQDFVYAVAESINVDVAFSFLPLLSAIGVAIGNSRSVSLKRGFVQPPVIWSAIIARSGGRKSPSIDTATFAVTEHERELIRQNDVAMEIYKEELATWENQSRKMRGAKPSPPSLLTCCTDDLTIESLADLLMDNPRGFMVRKDELSHWVASFDQYKNAKGSDVARWLTLHSAFALAIDRRTDRRQYRIMAPRVCITGGIQPKILRRVLTPEFFERGLPARFIFAFPPFLQDRWSDAVVSDKLRAQVLKLFEQLWLLQASEGNPLLLPFEPDAKAAFIDFYNQCGESALEAEENEEATWGKLSGYGARFALIGQIADQPKAEIITVEVMQSACELALWSGSEAHRIYGALSETQEQREERELIEFIRDTRGGVVSVRECMQFYRPLRNQRDETERRLNILRRKGLGKWEDAPTTAEGGRPTRVFCLNSDCRSTKPNQFTNESEEVP